MPTESPHQLPRGCQKINGQGICQAPCLGLKPNLFAFLMGSACAFSLQRKLGNKAGKVAVLEKKVLGAGLSSRHSAIVRSANASPMAARMAKLATGYWKDLKPIWGVEIPYEQSGAIWIGKMA